MPSVTPKKQKKWFFWSIPYKIEIIMTSVIEMLELPNFGHMTDFSIESGGGGGVDPVPNREQPQIDPS